MTSSRTHDELRQQIEAMVYGSPDEGARSLVDLLHGTGLRSVAALKVICDGLRGPDKGPGPAAPSRLKSFAQACVDANRVDLLRKVVERGAPAGHKAQGGGRGARSAWLDSLCTWRVAAEDPDELDELDETDYRDPFRTATDAISAASAPALELAFDVVPDHPAVVSSNIRDFDGSFHQYVIGKALTPAGTGNEARLEHARHGAECCALLRRHHATLAYAGGAPFSAKVFVRTPWQAVLALANAELLRAYVDAGLLDVDQSIDVAPNTRNDARQNTHPLLDALCEGNGLAAAALIGMGCDISDSVVAHGPKGATGGVMARASKTLTPELHTIVAEAMQRRKLSRAANAGPDASSHQGTPWRIFPEAVAATIARLWRSS